MASLEEENDMSRMPGTVDSYHHQSKVNLGKAIIMEASLEQVTFGKQIRQATQLASLSTKGCSKVAISEDMITLHPHAATLGDVSFLGKSMSYWALMAASSVALIVGLSSATLLGRYYFVNGGSKRWVYTWIESAGWPILLIPLACCYATRIRKQGVVNGGCAALKEALTPKLCLIFVAMGFLTAFDNLLYSIGLSYLPVSTNSLVCSSQLAFNAMFAYVLVGQKLSAYVVNSIVIISTGTVILGVSAENDKPPGTTQKEYIIGLVVTIIASAIYALMLPLLQLIYTKAFSKATFVVVLEVQIAISSVAATLSLFGMLVHGDLRDIHIEALHFESGVSTYILTLLFSAIGWQLYVLGSSGIIFLSSSLMSCVFMTAMIPVLPILAVVFFHDSFSVLKGIAMLLSIWGFISYLYDGYMVYKKPAEFSVP